MGEEKKHDPTDHKLQEERKKGNLFKSTDVTNAVVIFVSAYAMSFIGSWVYQYVFKYVIETFETIPEYMHLTYTQAIQLLLRTGLVILLCILPFLLILYITIIIVMYAQVGWLISMKPLGPKFENLNPGAGIKKLNPFKMKQVISVGKSLIIMLLVGYYVFKVLRAHMGTILQSVLMPPAAALSLIGALTVEMFKQVAILMVIIAVAFRAIEKWQWWKSMKMTDKEIRDEYKNLEGDPHIKAKQRQKGMEIAMGGAHDIVPNADVIVTNPTHYAIALEYKPKRGMKAPLIIFKGKNADALLIRRIAEENFVPIVEDAPTAQALFKVKINQPIPQELFVAVAKIIATIMKKRQRGPVTQAPRPSLENFIPPVFVDEEEEGVGGQGQAMGGQGGVSAPGGETPPEGGAQPEPSSPGEGGAPEAPSPGEGGAPEAPSPGEGGAPEAPSPGERGAPEAPRGAPPAGEGQAPA